MPRTIPLDTGAPVPDDPQAYLADLYAMMVTRVHIARAAQRFGKLIQPYGGGGVTGVTIRGKYLIERHPDRYVLRVRYRNPSTGEGRIVDVTDEPGPWWSAISEANLAGLIQKVDRIIAKESKIDQDQRDLERAKDSEWRALARDGMTEDVDDDDE